MFFFIFYPLWFENYSSYYYCYDKLLSEAIQVIPERVRHIEYTPSMPEPYYVPSGKEPKPKLVGEETGTVVFRYSPTSATNYVSFFCVFIQTFLSS